jgi:hypothetical protein
MGALEFLGPDHGQEQVDEEEQDDDTRDEVFHICLLELLAEARVKAADHEKENDKPEAKEVCHRFSRLSDAGFREAEDGGRATAQVVRRLSGFGSQAAG